MDRCARLSCLIAFWISLEQFLVILANDSLSPSVAVASSVAARFRLAVVGSDLTVAAALCPCLARTALYLISWLCAMRNCASKQPPGLPLVVLLLTTGWMLILGGAHLPLITLACLSVIGSGQFAR